MYGSITRSETTSAKSDDAMTSGATRKCDTVRATRRWRPCWTRISSTKPRVSRVVKPIGTNRSPNELRQRELAEERELTRLQQWVYVGLGLSVAHWVQPPAGSLRLALLSEALSFPSRVQS